MQVAQARSDLHGHLKHDSQGKPSLQGSRWEDKQRKGKGVAHAPHNTDKQAHSTETPAHWTQNTQKLPTMNPQCTQHHHKPN